jgi:iron complex outermembrane receptor protein
MRFSNFKVRLWTTAAASVLGLAMAGAAVAAEAADDGAVDELVVTGTRDVTRTQFTTLAPVDVLSEKALKASVSSEVGDAMAALVPSFNVQKLPTSDGLQFIRPATLRNLSPDETLVLVNGKRFHRTAFLGQRGAQGPDLAQIPNFAVQHIEVLRDGASAQYGSDAIAGVINIMLNDQPGFAGYAQGSQFYKGDGATYQLGGRAGWAIGDGGHVTATAEWNKGDATSRSRQRDDAKAFQAAHPTIKVDNPVQRWGNPDLETYRGAIDAALPLGDFAEAYAFGTAGKTEGVNDINWRNPDATPSAYNTTPVFPGFNLKTLYPGGFTPHEGIKAKDFQSVAGLRHNTGEKFTWDLSASYGRNQSDFYLDNSINASLGPASPTSFYLGRLQQDEFNLNADGVYRLNVPGLVEPVNVAFGAERRVETYRIEVGDPASYAVGPGAAVGLAPNSNGFPGYNPQQAGKWDQTSYAAYVDLESQITEQWTLGAAGRYEDFSEFGSKFTGKLATRFAFTPDFAVRGSYSTGFRAPTPAQLNSTSTSQGLDTVTLQLFTSGRLSPLNPVAQFLGAKPLQPEESETFTGGFVWRNNLGFSGSVDVYQIDVKKRFSTSATIIVTPALRAQLVALGVAGASAFTQVNWFTNDFDTRTRGVDVVGAYTHPVGPGRLDLTGAYNYNETTVTRGSLTASETQKRTFEESRPKQNLTGSATYGWGPVELMGRVRYYGKWTDSTGNATGDIFQSFGAVTFVDVAVTYQASDKISIRVGAENVLDTYPDEAVFQASRGLVYSRNSPYDTNGGNYYVRLDAKF